MQFLIRITILLCSDCNHFKPDDMTAVANSNLKKILKSLQNYYEEVLGKSIDTSTIDVAAITRSYDHDEIINLLELVISCSVLCENKSYFSQNIFSLDHSSQTFLQGMVQRGLGRRSEISTSTALDSSSASIERKLAEDELKFTGESERGGVGVVDEVSAGRLSVDDVQAREMAKHLLEERQRLMTALETAENKNAVLTGQVQSLQSKLSVFEQERANLAGSDHSRASASSTTTTNLQLELEQAQRDLDLKTVEVEGLQESLQATLQRYESAKAQQARQEVEIQQITDELDLARDTSRRLAQAEATIEKYQRRLEELNAIKKQNKDLEVKMEEYLDKIHELESGYKSIAAPNKKIEQYKNENVVLDREKIEAMSALIGKEKQIESLVQEVKIASEAKKVLEGELDRARYFTHIFSSFPLL
jgi:hypothetical protein